MRARAWRIAKALAVAVLALCAIVALALATFMHSAAGRERLRRITLEAAAGRLTGSLHLGALRFGPGCAVGVDSLSLHDGAGALVVATGPLHARCTTSALVRGRLVLSALTVERPRVVLARDTAGGWNWERVIRRDTTPAPPDEGPPRVIVHGPLRISGGDVRLALASPDGKLAVRRWSDIELDAAEVRTDEPGALVAARLSRLGVTSSDPAIALRDARGTVRLARDGLSLDLARVALPGSSGRAAGRVSWGGPGSMAVDFTATLDTVSLADLAWISPSVPVDGGGRLRLRASSAGGDSARVDYALSDVDVTTHGSRMRGAATISVGGPDVAVRDVALDLAPLHTDLLRVLVGGPLPADLRGTFTGRVVARGGELRRFAIDSAQLRFADARLPGAVSVLGLRGALDVHAPARTAFRGLVVRVAPFELRTLARAIPMLDTIGGRVSGVATLDSVWSDVRLSAMDVTYQASAAAPALRLQGAGRLTSATARGAGLRYDLDLAARPLAPAALAHVYPALRDVASVEGKLRLHGSANTLAIVADLHGVGGALAIDASIDAGAAATVVAAHGGVRGLDPRVALGRATLPSGAVDGDFDLALTTGAPATRRLTLAVRDLGGRLAGVALHPSTIALHVEGGRLSLDTVALATGLGTARAAGALGLVADVRDSLRVELRSDSLAALVAALRRAGSDLPLDSLPAARDSLAGTLAIDAIAVGSTESFDLDASAELTGAAAAQGRAARVSMKATASGLPRERRGSATVRVDSLEASGVLVSRTDVDVATDDGAAWRVAMRTSDSDPVSGWVGGTVRLDSAATSGSVDSMALRLPRLTLRSTGGASFALERGGRFTLDTLELRGADGASFRLAGSAPDSAHLDAVVQVRGAPLRLPHDTVTRDSALALLDLDARLSGARADPVATLRSSIHGRVAGAFEVDSAVLLAGYEARRAHLELFTHGTAGELRADVTVPAAISLAPVHAELLAGPMEGELAADSLALSSLGRLLPGVVATAGRIDGRVQIGGEPRRPRLTGEVTLRGGAFSVPATGTNIGEASATIALAGDSVALRSVSLRGVGESPGRAELTGVVVGLADTAGPVLDLRLSAAALPVLRSPSLGDADVSATLHLAGPLSGATLSGGITVDRAELRIADVGRQGIVGVDDPEYVRLLDSLTARRAAGGGGQSAFVRGLRLDDVRVTVGPAVWLRSAEPNVKLGGAVFLTSSAGKRGAPRNQLALRGSVATERGTYTFDAGVVHRTFQLEKGSVEFDGEPELDPRLDINAIYSVATANDPRVQGNELRIRAHLGGTLSKPALTLSAADGPYRSEAELLSYLVTGQSEIALGGSNFVEREVGTELMSRATNRLAEQVTGNMFDVVSVTAGAAHDQWGLGSTSSSIFAGSRLGLGKQLSERTFLTVSAGLCSLAPNGGSSGTSVDATSFGDAIGVSFDYRFRRDAGASVSSEPATSALLCTSSSVGRGFAPTPRQWGADLFKAWRF